MPSQRRTHDHDEGWIVSYADMMTLLFGFFVILNSFANMDEKKLEEFGKQVSENLKGKYVDKPAAVVETDSDTERQLRAFRLLLSVMNPGSDIDSEVKRIEALTSTVAADQGAQAIVLEGLKTADKLVTAATDGIAADSVVEISLPGSTMFVSGSDELKPGATKSLQKMANTLARLNGLSAIEVVGHTDSSVPGKGSKFASNWALSAARAGSVADALAKSGVDRGLLITRGMADLSPIFPERAGNGRILPENQAKNRRVSIVVKKSKLKVAR